MVDPSLEKSLVMHERIEQEYEDKGSESSDYDEEDDSDDEKKWDVNTIQTTHTNTDNHPAVIKTASRVVRTKQKMELHK